jgi:hypothetical protein
VNRYRYKVPTNGLGGEWRNGEMDWYGVCSVDGRESRVEFLGYQSMYNLEKVRIGNRKGIENRTRLGPILERLNETTE